MPRLFPHSSISPKDKNKNKNSELNTKSTNNDTATTMGQKQSKDSEIEDIDMDEPKIALPDLDKYQKTTKLRPHCIIYCARMLFFFIFPLNIE
jgi:hypothetical protein